MKKKKTPGSESSDITTVFELGSLIKNVFKA